MVSFICDNKTVTSVHLYNTKSFYVTNKLYMPNSSFIDIKQKSKQNITRFYILTCALTSKQTLETFATTSKIFK